MLPEQAASGDCGRHKRATVGVVKGMPGVVRARGSFQVTGMCSSIGDERWRLQASLAAMSDWIAATPGVCNGGRALACDDLDALGWRRVERFWSETACSPSASCRWPGQPSW